MKKIFYDHGKWRAFEAPEPPPVMTSIYADMAADNRYQREIAKRMKEALPIGNAPIMMAIAFKPATVKDAVKNQTVLDWPGTAVIKDGKYILEI